MQHVFANQEPYRIGTIVEIKRKENKYHALIEITDPSAREVLQTAKVPPFVSPAIYPIGQQAQSDTSLSQWVGVHLAIVDDPAFGVKKAQITNTCSGEAGKCLLQLRKAHTEKHGNTCGFCIKSALQKLMFAQSMRGADETLAKLNDIAGTITYTNTLNSGLVINDSSSYNSSFLPSPNSLPSMENAPHAPAIDTSKFVAKEEHEKLVAENTKLKTDYGILQTAHESLKKEAGETAQRVAALEQASRKSKIASIITEEVIRDEKKRNETIDSLTALNLKDEDFQKAVAPLLEVAKIKQASRSKLQYNADEEESSSDSEPYFVRMFA